MATMRVLQRLSRGPYPRGRRKEAGVVPCTLIQRFGTSGACCWPSAAPLRPVFRSNSPPPAPNMARAKTLIDSIGVSGFLRRPKPSNGLAYLQIDLIDPSFTHTLAAIHRHPRRNKKLLDDAGRGRTQALRHRDLARLIQQVNRAHCSTGPLRKGSWPRCSAVL